MARTYPDDTDAATLFAEAMMDLRPWALWTLDGQPQPGTLEIVATLEEVLKKDPMHPGANHYYIHAIEASTQPERGLVAAERLHGLVPGAGHLVHMPSHIYMRTGRYADAADANVQAIKVDEAYIATVKPDGVYPMMYYPHNIHFLWAAASMEGRSADAIRAGREVTKNVSPEMVKEMGMVEYFVPTALFALARFGKWSDILAEPAPPPDQPYATGIWHYARGLAFAATGQLDEAAKEQQAVAAAAAAMPPDRIIGDNTPAAALLHIAADTLAGEIAARRGQTDDAVKHLQEAVRAQDALPYSEPPPWYYPARQSLGAVLLAAGRPAEAEVSVPRGSRTQSGERLVPVRTRAGVARPQGRCRSSGDRHAVSQGVGTCGRHAHRFTVLRSIVGALMPELVVDADGHVLEPIGALGALLAAASPRPCAAHRAQRLGTRHGVRRRAGDRHRAARPAGHTRQPYGRD